MARIALPTLTLATAGQALSAWADSTEAFCRLSRHDHSIPVEEGPCRFNQRQGNVNVEMGNRRAIRFSREGQYTLSVFWQKPEPLL